jgi:hypothetical protein
MSMHLNTVVNEREPSIAFAGTRVVGGRNPSTHGP